MKLHNLKQAVDENIADYLRRAGELAIKLPTDNIEAGMATLKGMKDSNKLDRITFECNKDSDYSFTHVSKSIKAAYSEVGKINP